MNKSVICNRSKKNTNLYK